MVDLLLTVYISDNGTFWDNMYTNAFGCATYDEKGNLKQSDRVPFPAWCNILLSNDT